MNRRFKFNKYGNPARSNIKWGYNLDLVKKILLTILSAIFLVSFWLFLNEKKEKKVIPVAVDHEYKEENSVIDNETKALQGILRDIQARNRGESIDSVYVWNEKGKIHASNTRYPVENKYVRVVEGVSNSGRETKFIKHGGSILLPVILENNGKMIQINMMLDTGCSITLLDAEISVALNFEPKGKISTSIADGSTRINRTGNIDLFQVGPYQEQNFLISTGIIMGSNKAQHGLLGMNFLEKHPFTIDHRRQVVVWQ